MGNKFAFKFRKLKKYFLSPPPPPPIESLIKPPKNIAHGEWVSFLSSQFNKPGMNILELGSRVVTGANLSSHFDKANYTGFDFYDGENVDVVGDAHKLSSYFKEDEKFDLILSSAVFEHLAMPWLAAEEIAKLLKLGGHIFVETHFSYSTHERPWNFFQFSDMGLRALFNKELGFDLIEMGLSNPIAGKFTEESAAYLVDRPVLELYCHSEIFCIKKREVENFSWSEVKLENVVDETQYPPPSNPQIESK